MELTWSISDDQRWTVISLCLCNRFDSLGRICAERDLSNVYITITHSNLCKALLADLFTSSSKLTNFTNIGSLRSLTAGIGVHLCIKYHNIYILAGSKYMV